jgi:hypothetical protein
MRTRLLSKERLAPSQARTAQPMPASSATPASAGHGQRCHAGRAPRAEENDLVLAGSVADHRASCLRW